jgi:predicted enzyme related to lactoylglutathione lyase
MQRTRTLLMAIALAGCATARKEQPRINPEPAAITPGRPVWHDLVTSDLDAAKRFYGGLFGWTFRDFEVREGKYALASLDGKPVAGILNSGKHKANVSQWVTYFSVADVDAAAALAKQAGAQVAVPPRDIANQGRAALLVDPQGAPVAVARLAGGDPAAAPPPLNGWLWVDLWTPDPAASSAFYRALLRPRGGGRGRQGAPFTVLGRDDKAYAGMIRIPAGDPSTGCPSCGWRTRRPRRERPRSSGGVSSSSRGPRSGRGGRRSSPIPRGARWRSMSST